MRRVFLPVLTFLALRVTTTSYSLIEYSGCGTTFFDGFGSPGEIQNAMWDASFLLPPFALLSDTLFLLFFGEEAGYMDAVRCWRTQMFGVSPLSSSSTSAYSPRAPLPIPSIPSFIVIPSFLAASPQLPMRGNVDGTRAAQAPSFA
ncbi:hypothetical protein DFH06DRAFT_1334920 [Mycena polygramma]|nr:hypothetical protein DFH06DRAFT_1334920 [Mycena polygramma]